MLLWTFVFVYSFYSFAEDAAPQPPKREPLKWVFGDNILESKLKFRVESYGGKNLTLLNDNNGNLDSIIIPAKHTIDWDTFYIYGLASHKYEIIRIKTTIRNRGTWGAPETIASTDDAVVNIGGVVTGKHSHTIHRHLIWIREMWLQATLADMLNICINPKHTFTLGFFPFQLGRGIALGDAYATDPDLLGYYSPNVVDQYAPGFKFSGELLPVDMLNYDLYVAILSNKSNTFNNVNAKILSQEFGHRLCPARGFGVLNWLFAWRFKWVPLQQKEATISFEPYFLYDNQREQRIEFAGDASSKLATAGLAMEATIGDVEFGFDFARNFGHQSVKGWDRNILIPEVRNGSVVVVNTDVTAIASIAPDVAGKRALFTPANQAIINNSIRAENLNGKPINGSNLQNSISRFNNPYQNKLTGFMFVGDAAYRFAKCFKAAIAFGLATGDINPNRDIDELGDSNKDGDYQGFIGVQEIYTGTRVRSAYLMSGQAKVPRVLSFPSVTLPLEERFPDTVSHFNNLILVGASGTVVAGRWTINPNILNYWEEHATRKFNRSTDISGSSFASTWLGVEVNTFAEVKLCNDMRCYAVAAVFFPGKFFSDIKCQPLTRAQQEFLEGRRTGEPREFVLTVGNDIGLFANVGIEYRF